MTDRPQISIIIPAYNEESRLGPTLRHALEYFRARGRPFEIIVVDDGSRDGTSALVSGFRESTPELRLIRLAANRGKGHAVRSGVVNSRGDLVLFADADGATPFEEVERLEEALSSGADVAIGSRALKNEAVQVQTRFYRKLIGRTFHMLVSLLTVKGIHDTQCGFKLFSAAVAHDLFARMRMDGFIFDVEVLLLAERRGFTIREVPVNWTHMPGSKVNLVTDSLRMARDLFIIRGHSIRGNYEQPQVALPFESSKSEPPNGAAATSSP